MPALLPLNNNKNSAGFTIIEVVAAVFLITVGVLGAFTVVQRTVAFSSVVSDQLAAAYLAQEGTENIRNIRDGNWLEQRKNLSLAWDDGINSSDWQVVSFLDGSQSKFQRKITIQKPEADKVVVQVQVQWLERGRTHNVKAETELYNWK